jgi:hypothetical protein
LIHFFTKTVKQSNLLYTIKLAKSGIYKTLDALLGVVNFHGMKPEASAATRKCRGPANPQVHNVATRGRTTNENKLNVKTIEFTGFRRTPRNFVGGLNLIRTLQQYAEERGLESNTQEYEGYSKITIAVRHD